MPIVSNRCRNDYDRAQQPPPTACGLAPALGSIKMPHPPLILASRSPRRRELLAEAGYQFQILAPDDDVECGVCSESGPAGLVSELAFRKAAAVVRKLQND